jgi:hypothetical protein
MSTAFGARILLDIENFYGACGSQNYRELRHMVLLLNKTSTSRAKTMHSMNLEMPSTVSLLLGRLKLFEN